MNSKSTESSTEEKVIKDLKGKTCFIITPIGADNSEIRRKAEGLIEAVIDPVLKELEIGSSTPQGTYKSGSITKQIINAIIDSDLVIANLTGLNPNVMYELAIRHAKRKSVISLVEDGTLLPFDIKDERTIIYKDDMSYVPKTRTLLKGFILQSFEDIKQDNPISRATTEIIFDETDSVGVKDYLINRLDEIESKISNLNQPFLFRNIDVPVKTITINHIGNRQNLKRELGEKFGFVLASLDCKIGKDTYTYDVSNLSNDSINGLLVALKQKGINVECDFI